MEDQKASELKTNIITQKAVKGEPHVSEEQTRGNTLSLPTPANINRLNVIRQLDWFDRTFRKLDTGSLRGVVIMWIRMTLGIGILTLPFYIMQYGALTGMLVIAIAATINLLTYRFIFEASFFTDKKNYADLIEELLGTKILRVFRVTFMLDITSTMMIYCIVSWNLFEYILYFFKIGEDQWGEWFININKVQFNENNPTIFKIRGAFLYSVFLITIPLFLKKNLDALQKITIGYLFALFLLVFIILCEVPFFKMGYADEDIDFHFFKAPSFNWIECFFGLCISFYVQPFIFSLRGELLLPSLERTKKIAKISVSIEALTFVVLGFFGYWALGDMYTPNLFILRSPFSGKNQISELIFRCAIAIFFALNTLGLAMYNPSLREYLYPFINIKNERVKYVVVSLLPFFIICTTAFIYPFIINITNFFGVTVYNFNGYIIPLLMKIKILRLQKEPLYKLVLACIALAVFILLGVVGLGLRIFGFIDI